jgi:O-antigen/teichoic acid export membrane protein
MIILNAVAQLTALGAVIIMQTVYSIAAARLLGVEDFGRFSFVFSITQILLIGCDLGLHNTALRKIALCLAKPPLATTPQVSEIRPDDRAANIFGTFFSLKVVASLALVGCAGVLSALLTDGRETRLALLLFAGGMFFQSLNTALNVTFQAHGKLYLGSLNNVLMALLNLGIATTFIFMGGRVAALGLAYMLAMAAAFLINCMVFEKHVYPLRLGGLQYWRELVQESVPVGLGTLFNTIAARIDVTLLVLLAGSYQTGIYSAAYRIYGSLLNIPIAIFSAVLPAMASFGEKRERVRVLFDRSVASMLAIAVLLAVGFSGFAGVLINVLYGKAYAASAGILSILGWSLVPAFVGMAFSNVILSQATLVRRLPAIASAAVAANITLNLLLIPRMGNRGAAFATLGTEATLAILYATAARNFLFSNNESIKTGWLEALTRRAFGALPSPRGKRF